MGAAASTSDEIKKRGNEAFKAGDYRRSVELYTEAIQHSPGDHLLYSNRAAALLGLGEPAKALVDALTSTQLQPSWAKGYYRQGIALRALSREPEALEAFVKAVALHQQDADIRKAFEETKAAVETAGKDKNLIGIRGNGSLYSWGSGADGALGFGDSRNKAAPKVVDHMRGMAFVDIACGINFTIALTTAREVYAWGKNAQGQCGVAHKNDIVIPELIPGLQGLEATGVACGAAHTVVITDKCVFSWGLGVQGQLGRGDTENCATPQPVPALENINIAAVACGIAHTFLLDKEGLCWAYGWNQQGQLGFGHTDNICTPTKVPLQFKVQHIACGGGHTAIVSVEGEIYTTGSGNCGQLGHGDLLDMNTFTLVQAFTFGKIAFVACGEEFTIAITASHKVYAWGLGNVGQLGDGKRTDYSTPQHIKALDNLRVISVACSQGQAIAITESGQVFMWGLPGHEADLVSLNANAIQSTPTEFKSLSRKKILRLECGRKHYCAVVNGAWAPFCVVDGIKDAMAGDRVKFTITSKDTLKSACSQGGDRFHLTLTHDSGAVVMEGLDLFDNMDGTYAGEYKLLKAGDYSLSITLHGISIAQSPFHILVQPGPPHPPTFVLETWSSADEPTSNAEPPTQEGKPAPSKVTVEAGESLYFTLAIVDKYSNRINDANCTYLKMKIDGKPLETVAAFVQDDGDLYTSCALNVVGEYSLKVLYEDPEVEGTSYEVMGSPLAVAVVAGEISLADCIVSGDGLSKATVQHTASFTVSMVDAHGNKIPSAIAVAGFRGYLKGPNGKRIKCKSQGSEQWTYTPKTSGAHQLHLLMDGKPIGGSPYTVQVEGAGGKEESASESEAETVDDETRLRQKAERKAKRKAEREAQKKAKEEAKRLRKLQLEEMTRRRAQEALLKKQQEMRIAEQERIRRASAKRVGGGFVVKYNTWVDSGGGEVKNSMVDSEEDTGDEHGEPPSRDAVSKTFTRKDEILRSASSRSGAGVVLADVNSGP